MVSNGPYRLALILCQRLTFRDEWKVKDGKSEACCYSLYAIEKIWQHVKWEEHSDFEECELTWWLRWLADGPKYRDSRSSTRQWWASRPKNILWRRENSQPRAELSWRCGKNDLPSFWRSARGRNRRRRRICSAFDSQASWHRPHFGPCLGLQIDLCQRR